jgi:hypothetical protein
MWMHRMNFRLFVQSWPAVFCDSLPVFGSEHLTITASIAAKVSTGIAFADVI